MPQLPLLFMCRPSMFVTSRFLFATHLCMRTYIYIHTYIHTYIHACIHTYIHTNIHTNIHTYIHNTYIHACIHTYIHTIMHAVITDYPQPKIASYNVSDLIKSDPL